MSEDMVLRVFWWLVLGAFVAAIAIALAGELGLVLLLRWLGRSEAERNDLLARAGRPAEGHQVWLVVIGGALAGAWWPLFRASLFSGLWLVLLFLGLAALVGPLGRGYRGRVGAPRRALWDLLWAAVSLAALIMLGTGVSTEVRGVPLHFGPGMQPLWGEFTARFTAFGVVVPGLLALAAGVFLAASRVAARCEGIVARRARTLLLPAGALAFLLFLGGMVWLTQVPGYAVAGLPVSTVIAVPGAYLEQFLGHFPEYSLPGHWVLLTVPVFTGLSLLAALFYAWRGRLFRVWPLAALAVAGMVATVGTMTYPVVLPSRTVPAQSLTIWNAMSDHRVLVALLVWLSLLLPAAAAYEAWVRGQSAAAASAGNSAH